MKIYDIWMLFWLYSVGLVVLCCATRAMVFERSVLAAILRPGLLAIVGGSTGIIAIYFLVRQVGLL